MPSFIKIREDTNEVYLFIHIGEKKIPGIDNRTKYVIFRLAQMSGRPIGKGFERIIDRKNLFAVDHNGESRNYGRIIERYDLRIESDPAMYMPINSIYVVGGGVCRVIEKDGKFFFDYWGPLLVDYSFLEAAGISSIISSEFIELFNETAGKEPVKLGPFGRSIFMNQACLPPHRRQKGQRTLCDIIGVQTEEVIPSSR